MHDELGQLRNTYRICCVGFAMLTVGFSMIFLYWSVILFSCLTLQLQFLQWLETEAVTFFFLIPMVLIKDLGLLMLWGRWTNKTWYRRSGLLMLMAGIDLVYLFYQNSDRFGLDMTLDEHRWMISNIAYLLHWAIYGTVGLIAFDIANHRAVQRTGDRWLHEASPLDNLEIVEPRDHDRTAQGPSGSAVDLRGDRDGADRSLEDLGFLDPKDREPNGFRYIVDRARIGRPPVLNLVVAGSVFVVLSFVSMTDWDGGWPLNVNGAGVMHMIMTMSIQGMLRCSAMVVLVAISLMAFSRCRTMLSKLPDANSLEMQDTVLAQIDREREAADPFGSKPGGPDDF